MKLEKKKNKIFVHREPIELEPAGVTDSLIQTLQAIKQNQAQLNEAEKSKQILEKDSEEYLKNEEFIKKCKSNIEVNTDFYNKLRKFESWAEKIQLSKLKIEIDLNKDKILKDFNYEYDEMGSAKFNNIQRFQLYKSYLSRVPEIEENVHLSIVNKYLLQAFNEKVCLVKNPFTPF